MIINKVIPSLDLTIVEQTYGKKYFYPTKNFPNLKNTGVQ